MWIKLIPNNMKRIIAKETFVLSRGESYYQYNKILEIYGIVNINS